MPHSIEFTDGQLNILLAMTPDPEKYDEATISLVRALHGVKPRGHKWLTQLTDRDIETALTLFQTRKDDIRTPASQQALQFFVRDSPYARQVFDARRTQADVPRETSQGEQ